MTDAEWTSAYRAHGGGLGREACADPTTNCKSTDGSSREGVDGLKNRERDEKFMLDEFDYCKTVCRYEDTTLADGTKLKTADCRTPETVAHEAAKEEEERKKQENKS